MGLATNLGPCSSFSLLNYKLITSPCFLPELISSLNTELSYPKVVYWISPARVLISTLNLTFPKERNFDFWSCLQPKVILLPVIDTTPPTFFSQNCRVIFDFFLFLIVSQPIHPQLLLKLEICTKSSLVCLPPNYHVSSSHGMSPTLLVY